jgi:hypothetical protein
MMKIDLRCARSGLINQVPLSLRRTHSGPIIALRMND